MALSRLALPRIAGVLAERQGTINSDVNMAEELKEKAVAAEEAYNKALNDARSEAARIVEATKAEIKEELDAAITMADAQISEKAKAGEIERFTGAPHFAPLKRLDETGAARNPVLRWRANEGEE